jgi:cellulose synthase/poly-beta-1,6-N-acetylglucosamine synthase-like glycosyltransferase
MLSIIDFALVGVFAVVYAWIFYNLPILAAGVRNLRKCKQNHQAHHDVESGFLPSFSIVVPVKNEAKIVGRLFAALSNLNYPSDKVEIVVVEDGSVDHTFEVCRQFADTHRKVKVFQRPFSSGKPSALNYGLQHAEGEIVAVFDADSVPASDALLKAAKYFDDPAVAAVQGRNLSINSQENMLTQFLSYEEAVWCEAYLRGKDVLDLFVHLKGSCQFIRRDVLEQLTGFDENVLSEDMEFSARLTNNGYKIRYGGDVRAWQESPANLKTLFKQRTRWFRGTMEVAFKYGKLMAKLSRKNLDAEATLFGPFILIASLLSYLVASGAFFAAFPFDILWQAFMYFSTLTTTLMILVCGFALIYVSKPKRLRSLLWLPFVYSYWCLQAFISLYAALLILLRRPKRWLKTEKKGVIADSAFVLEKEQVHA